MSSTLLDSQRKGIEALRAAAYRLARELDDAYEDGRTAERAFIVGLGISERGPVSEMDLDRLIGAFRNYVDMRGEELERALYSEAVALKRWIYETGSDQ